MRRLGVDDNARGTNGAVYAVRLAGLADTHAATHAIKILDNCACRHSENALFPLLIAA